MPKTCRTWIFPFAVEMKHIRTQSQQPQSRVWKSLGKKNGPPVKSQRNQKAFCYVRLRWEKLFWSCVFSFFLNLPLWENKQEVWLESKGKTIFCLETISCAAFWESFASAVLNCFKEAINLISELRLGKIWSAAVWPWPSQTQSQSGSKRSGGGPSEH